MLASNQHDHPSIAPGSPLGRMLTLPDCYLDLMFGELPEPGPDELRADPIEQSESLTVAV